MQSSGYSYLCRCYTQVKDSEDEKSSEAKAKAALDEQALLPLQAASALEIKRLSGLNLGFNAVLGFEVGHTCNCGYHNALQAEVFGFGFTAETQQVGQAGYGSR